MDKITNVTNINDNIHVYDNMFITFDNVISIRELSILEDVLLSNYDKYKDTFNISPFLNMDNQILTRCVLERTKRNIKDWLLIEGKEYDEDIYDSAFITNYQLTDLANGLPNLIRYDIVSKIVIAMDVNDKKQLKIISDLFSDEILCDKVFIVDNSEKTILEYFRKSSFTSIITDEINLLKKCSGYLKGKYISVPMTGYNTEIKTFDKEGKQRIALCRDNLELFAMQEKFELGIIETYRIKKDMFLYG